MTDAGAAVARFFAPTAAHLASGELGFGWIFSTVIGDDVPALAAGLVTGAVTAAMTLALEIVSCVPADRAQRGAAAHENTIKWFSCLGYVQ